MKEGLNLSCLMIVEDEGYQEETALLTRRDQFFAAPQLVSSAIHMSKMITVTLFSLRHSCI